MLLDCGTDDNEWVPAVAHDDLVRSASAPPPRTMLRAELPELTSRDGHS
jgi:hypothetical protein